MILTIILAVLLLALFVLGFYLLKFVSPVLYYLHLIEIAAYKNGYFGNGVLLAAQNQARLESANFTSHLFVSNNNGYGMKVAHHRSTTAKGERNGYAYYSNFFASADDYFRLLKSMGVKDSMNYAAVVDYVLVHHYAEDKDYSVKMANLQTSHNKPSRPVAVAGTFFMFACLIIFVPLLNFIRRKYGKKINSFGIS